MDINATTIAAGLNLILLGVAYGTLRTKVNGNCRAVKEMKSQQFLTVTAHNDLCSSHQQLIFSELNHLKDDIGDLKNDVKEMDRKRDASRVEILKTLQDIQIAVEK
jgi:hypothetical protein